jgi:hypothetical protein
MKITAKYKPHQRLITWRSKKTLKAYGSNGKSKTALLYQSITALEIEIKMTEGIATRSCGITKLN